MAAAKWACDRGDIVWLVLRTTGVQRLGRDMTRIVGRAISFDGSSLLTVDSATRCPPAKSSVMTSTRHLSPQPGFVAARIEIELDEPDFIKRFNQAEVVQDIRR
jgi:hypothetical protein